MENETRVDKMVLNAYTPSNEEIQEYLNGLAIFRLIEKNYRRILSKAFANVEKERRRVKTLVMNSKTYDGIFKSTILEFDLEDHEKSIYDTEACGVHLGKLWGSLFRINEKLKDGEIELISIPG